MTNREGDMQASEKVVLTDKELDLLLWAVDGAGEAHRSDPEEFPAAPDWEDLEYRLSEQALDDAQTKAELRSVSRVSAALLAKLNRAPYAVTP